MAMMRKQQMAAFSEDQARRFEERMVDHVRRCFPSEWRDLGEAQVREWIRTGVARAAEYGIDIEYDVARFVDLKYILAEDFDSNPEIPWAAAILKAPGLDATTRMNRLYERSMAELKTLADQEGKGG